MSRDELVERFTLERVGASPATFDYKKLDWMNGVYLRALPPEAYADAAGRVPPRAGLRLGRGARAPRGAARAGEDRAPRRVPRLRRLPLRRRRARPGRAATAGAAVLGPRRGGARRRSSRSRRSRSRPRCAGSPSGSSSRRARRSSRSGSRSPARRSRRGSSRASSCWGASGRSARIASAARGGGSGLGARERVDRALELRHARRRNCGDGCGSLACIAARAGGRGGPRRQPGCLLARLTFDW